MGPSQLESLSERSKRSGLLLNTPARQMQDAAVMGERATGASRPRIAAYGNEHETSRLVRNRVPELRHPFLCPSNAQGTAAKRRDYPLHLGFERRRNPRQRARSPAATKPRILHVETPPLRPIREPCLPRLILRQAKRAEGPPARRTCLLKRKNRARSARARITRQQPETAASSHRAPQRHIFLLVRAAVR